VLGPVVAEERRTRGLTVCGVWVECGCDANWGRKDGQQSVGAVMEVVHSEGNEEA
jgi:hypothetical protein